MPLGVPVKLASAEILSGLAVAAEGVSLPSGWQAANTMTLMEKAGGTSGGGNPDDFKYKSNRKVWDKIDEKNKSEKYKPAEKVDLEKECKKTEKETRARGGKRRRIRKIKPWVLSKKEIVRLQNKFKMLVGENVELNCEHIFRPDANKYGREVGFHHDYQKIWQKKIQF